MLRRKLGLYGLPSLVNHSCRPNAVRLSIGDTLFVRATKPILKGPSPFTSLALRHPVHPVTMQYIWYICCISLF